MGFFDKIKANLEEAKRRDQLHNQMMRDSREADSRRPGIRDLDFKVLDPAIGSDPRYTNSGYIKKIGVDDFLACIRSGKAEYAEVVVVTTHEIIVDSDYSVLREETDYIYRIYAKVADLNGVVHRETVITAKEKIIPEWPSNWWDEQYKNPDVVDPSGLAHAYILHYYIQNTEYFLLVEPDEFNDLSKVFLRLKNRPKAGCLEPDKSCRCWW